MPEIQELVDLDQAKASTKYPDGVTNEDDDLQDRLDLAHALVLDRIKNRRDEADAWAATVDAWDADTVPLQVKGAILAMFGYLYRHRGDDEQDARPKLNGDLPEEVVMYIRRYVDPTLA